MPTSNIQFRGFVERFLVFFFFSFFFNKYSLLYSWIEGYLSSTLWTFPLFFFFSFNFSLFINYKLRFVFLIRRKNQPTAVYQLKEAQFLTLASDFSPSRIWQDSFSHSNHRFFLSFFSFRSFFLSFYLNIFECKRSTNYEHNILKSS